MSHLYYNSYYKLCHYFFQLICHANTHTHTHTYIYIYIYIYNKYTYCMCVGGCYNIYEHIYICKHQTTVHL